MSDDPEKAQLDALSERIEDLKRSAATEAPRGDEHFSGAQQGWRMVTELVAGLLIGLSLGYGLDWLFGTLPIFLLLFTLLGFGAGVNVMMRTAKEVQNEHFARDAGGEKDDTHGG
ncbi:ATP synthase protein I [Litoreibacter ponti]|uniref:ATP synthase protein I n=1 Tax=Litoreibacter ponti TaxID=1510457 RepID=A0A2T6BEC3_9RHOB|nr:AtpZ/AtpI family protein [Litoreibacter ponti]PTX54410.1 ATP synthase protein I [Litoreibacter ponti]